MKRDIYLALREAFLTLVAVALLALCGCQMQEVARESNGPDGDTTLKLPVPVWPFGPCQSKCESDAQPEEK